MNEPRSTETSDAELDALNQLRLLGEELRGVFAEERRAIAALDHAKLEQLAAHKQRLAEALSAFRTLDKSPVARDLFAAIRVEARATAMLAATAAEAVRTMLGYETTGGYGRGGRRTTSIPTGRTLVAL
jgi:hypothetical protein